MKKVLMWKMEETKVIYHIDDEDTPYLVKLPKSPTDVTLSDFKNVLNRPSYKFFFKSMDDDFGWVCNRMSVMLILFLGTVCVVFCRFQLYFNRNIFVLKDGVCLHNWPWNQLFWGKDRTRRALGNASYFQVVPATCVEKLCFRWRSAWQRSLNAQGAKIFCLLLDVPWILRGQRRISRGRFSSCRPNFFDGRM